MTRRVRLLVYDGPEDWIEYTKAHEFITPESPYQCCRGIVRSIELDPAEITLFECKIPELPNDTDVQS
jgi:hypothetical protein